MKNGDEIIEVVVKKGELVEKPEDPIKENSINTTYTFSHWQHTIKQLIVLKI